jgi:hypothetical protein
MNRRSDGSIVVSVNFVSVIGFGLEHDGTRAGETAAELGQARQGEDPALDGAAKGVGVGWQLQKLLGAVLSVVIVIQYYLGCINNDMC